MSVARADILHANNNKKKTGSAIYYYNDEQKRLAVETRDHFNALLKEAGRNPTTTEIAPAPEYYFAEDYREYLISFPCLRVSYSSSTPLTDRF